MDTLALEHTRAALTTTNTFKHALLLVEHDGLAAAILDHALGDDKSTRLYKRPNERDIPFMIYSGLSTIEGETHGALHIQKPATHKVLVASGRAGATCGRFRLNMTGPLASWKQMRPNIGQHSASLPGSRSTGPPVLARA
jgi:hypothetical protein